MTGEQFNTRLDEEKADALHDFADKNDLSQYEATRELLEHGLRETGHISANDGARQSSIDWEMVGLGVAMFVKFAGVAAIVLITLMAIDYFNLIDLLLSQIA